MGTHRLLLESSWAEGTDHEAREWYRWVNLNPTQPNLTHDAPYDQNTDYTSVGLPQQTVTADADGYADEVMVMVEDAVKVREIWEEQQAIKNDVVLVDFWSSRCSNRKSMYMFVSYPLVTLLTPLAVH
jgi:hypothetical protein